MGADLEWFENAKGWVIQEAGIRFRVRKVKKKYTPWRARWYEEGRPRTLFAARLPAIKAKVEKRIEKVRQAGRSAVTLDDSKIRDAHLCWELLQRFRGTLPSDCVRDWLNRRGAQAGSKLLPEAVDDYLATRVTTSVDTASDRKSRLNRFAKDNADLYVSDVTTGSVQAWLDELRNPLQLSPQSIENYRRVLSAFFSHCRRKQWRPDNPLEDIERIELPKKEPVYFTIKEVRQILATAVAHPELDLLGYFTLALFAGIRPDELGREERPSAEQSQAPIRDIKREQDRRRLDWSDIDLSERLIDIPAVVSKICERRLIEGHAGSKVEGREFAEPLPETLWPWLETARRTPFGQVTPRADRPDAWRSCGGGGNGRSATKFLPRQGRQFTRNGIQSGRVAPDGLDRRLRYFRALLGFKWKQDGMRHSFATYHYARHRNAALTAHFLGHHDVALVYSTYRGIVREAEATKFWALKPTDFESAICSSPKASSVSQ